MKIETLKDLYPAVIAQIESFGVLLGALSTSHSEDNYKKAQGYRDEIVKEVKQHEHKVKAATVGHWPPTVAGSESFKHPSKVNEFLTSAMFNAANPVRWQPDTHNFDGMTQMGWERTQLGKMFPNQKDTINQFYSVVEKVFEWYKSSYGQHGFDQFWKEANAHLGELEQATHSQPWDPGHSPGRLSA